MALSATTRTASGMVLLGFVLLGPVSAQKADEGERRVKEPAGPTLTVRPVPNAKKTCAAPRSAAAALERIVIPALQAEDKPAREVLDLLIAMARHEDAEKVGVNLLYQCSPAPLKRRVTLDVTNLRLGEALRYICQACGLDYVTEEYAVVIVERRR